VPVASRRDGPLYSAVPPDAVVVLADAHIGYGPPETESALHRFLELVPDLAGHLVINGDLFEFWFEYRSVIPRRAFPTLRALAGVRQRGVRLTLTGGNHDRWGGEFWRRELDAEFEPRFVELTLAGFRAWVGHGDGLGFERLGSRAFHAVVAHPVTRRVFRLLHPDAGFAVVERLSPYLAGKAKDVAARERSTDRQEAYARDLLAARPALDLVVMAHTHAPRLVEFDPRRWFVNPGSWAGEFRYAVINTTGPELRRFDPRA
jgi:UDP-2,3-diacylglucosamine hydrolase